MKHLLPLLTAAVVLGFVAVATAQPTHPSFDVSVAGRGPAMILIPGLLSSGEVWNGTIDRYKDRYTLHTVTLAGFGGPAPIGAPLLSRVRDELVAYIRAEKLDKPIVIGHSLGGFLAFWIGATAPDLVGGIIAVDGVPFLPALGNPAATAGSMSQPAQQIASLYATFSTDQLIAQSRMAMTSMITAPADLERALSWVARSDARTAGIAVAEVMTTDLREEIAKISAPVLLIGAAGAAPEAMRPAMAKAYALQVARLPAARVKIADQARHFIMFDDPNFLFSSIDEFLAVR